MEQVQREIENAEKELAQLKLIKQKQESSITNVQEASIKMAKAKEIISKKDTELQALKKRRSELIAEKRATLQAIKEQAAAKALADQQKRAEEIKAGTSGPSAPASKPSAPATASAPASQPAAPANQPSATTAVANAAAKAAEAATSAGNAALSAAVAASAVVMPSNVDGFSAFKILAIFLVIAIIIILIIKSGIVARTYNNINSVPSDANNASIARDQLAAIAPESDRLANGHAPSLEAFRSVGEGVLKKKEGFVSASADLPSATAPATAQQPQVVNSVTPGSATRRSVKVADDRHKMPPEGERALLNFSVLGCRVAGYLGPKMNGVFKEEDAIRNALSRGCRLFIFDIDYLERSPSKPVLVCRDENGNLLSNNVGSIAKAAASLAAFTRKQRMAATDPIIITLNVRRLPDKSPLARQNINFMGEIASQLVPLHPYLLRSVPQGDVQQQRLEEVLFKLPIQTYENQILLFANVDTRGFRQVEDAAAIPPARNLDLFVHARIYTSENSALYYYQMPTANTTAAALVQTYGYYENIPANRVTAEADKTRNTWSMAMDAELEIPPNAGQLEKLVSELGVQGIVIDPFADPAVLADVLSDAWFGKKSYITKPAEIRYKEPAVIAIAPADKRIDANGGMLVTPNVS